MRPEQRLRSRGDYDRVTRAGVAAVHPGFVLYYAPRTGEDRSRFGFVVSRRIGGAVVRNRVRRLLREAVRPLVASLRTPVDAVIVAREPIRDMTLLLLRDALQTTISRAGLTEQDTST